MNSRVYDVNMKQLALLLLPVAWRKPLIAGLVYACVAPLSYLHGLFLVFRTQTDYRLTHNGQTCYLRAVANDAFDPIERRITITDTDIASRYLLIPPRERGQGILIPMRSSGRAVIVNRRGFGGINGYDFLVNVPYELAQTIDRSRLSAIVGIYKLASKRFAINYT